ncbi:ROK family protein [Acidobacteriota bacterium]
MIYSCIMENSCNQQKHVVGVDLGGTKVEACLLDTERNLIARERIPSEADRGHDRVVRNIIDVIEKTAGKKSYDAVGIGTPGTYIEADDCLYGAPHTPTYEKPGLIALLRERLRVPLIVENDANCLALAEFFASCAGRYRHVMAVILGTGFGSGLILDNRLYRGANGGAGEIGHMSIDINGRLCECGRRGCVEAYLSGPSIGRRFAELGGETLNPGEIFKLYQSQDSRARQLFEESCRILAEMFADAVNVFDLEAVILGGGVSNLPIWYEKCPPIMEKSLFGVPGRKIPLLKTRLGDSAGVFGAAYLALRHFGFMDF